MKKHEEPRSVIIWIYIALILLSVPMLIAAHMEGYSANAYTSHSSLDAVILESKWISVNGTGISQPVSLPIKKPSGQPLILTRTLSPTECSGNKYLMFLSYHSAVSIYINGKIRYDYHTVGTFFPLEPSAYHFFKLDPSYAGSKITVIQDSICSSFQGTSEMMYVGDKASEIVMIIRKNTLAVFSYTILLTISLLFILVWGFIKILSNDYHNNSLVYLAMIALFMFIGGINDTKLTQFIFRNTEALCILNYEVIYFMEMSVVAYFLCSTDPYVVHVNKKLSFIPVFNFVICNILALTKSVNLEDSLFITHICLVTLAVFEVFVNLRSRYLEIKKNSNKTPHLYPETAGFLIFAVTVCIDVVRYYQGNKTDYAAYTRLGVIVFIMMLGIRSLTDYINVETIKNQSHVYRQLAMHDILTGLNNRTAYQEMMETLSNGDIGSHPVTVAMFDLNDLKGVNDEHGHEAGDRYITACASFINGFFKDFATLFRIGGDEFALICSPESDDRFMKAYAEMQHKYGETDRTEISFAYGYAKYDPRSDIDLYDTAKRADHMMYRCKAEMKAADRSPV